MKENYPKLYIFKIKDKINDTTSLEYIVGGIIMSIILFLFGGNYYFYIAFAGITFLGLMRLSNHREIFFYDDAISFYSSNIEPDGFAKRKITDEKSALKLKDIDRIIKFEHYVFEPSIENNPKNIILKSVLWLTIIVSYLAAFIFRIILILFKKIPSYKFNAILFLDTKTKNFFIVSEKLLNSEERLNFNNYLNTKFNLTLDELESKKFYVGIARI